MTRKGRSKVRAQEPTPPSIDELMEAGIVRVVGPEPLSADAVAAAYGFDDETELTPDQLVAAIDAVDGSEASPEVRNTLTDFLPALPCGLKPLALVEDRSVEQQIADGDYPNPFLLPGTPVERLTPEQLVERYPEFEPPSRRLLDDESIVKGIIHQIETSPKVRDAIARLMTTNAAITEANGGEPPTAYLNAMKREIDAQHERAEGRLASAIAPDLTLILGELWTVRLAKMATLAGQTAEQYLQTLLARAWTAMPRRSRVGE